METAITITLAAGAFFLTGAICIACDNFERRWRLKRLRKQMLQRPDCLDSEFAASLSGIQPTEVLEMRRRLAASLGIEAIKIDAAWRFREEPHLKNLEGFIFSDFASRYAPEHLRGGRTFQFPVGEVSTVGDLFEEANRLQKR